jgi:hypothetical protein
MRAFTKISLQPHLPRRMEYEATIPHRSIDPALAGVLLA